MKTKLIFLILLILIVNCSTQNQFVKEEAKEIITYQMEVIASSRPEAIEKADKILWEYTQLIWAENNQNVVIKIKSCEKMVGEDNKYLVIYTEEIY